MQYFIHVLFWIMFLINFGKNQIYGWHYASGTAVKVLRIRSLIWHKPALSIIYLYIIFNTTLCIKKVYLFQSNVILVK